MLGLKFLHNNVGKLTYTNIILSAASMSAEVRLRKKNRIRLKKQLTLHNLHETMNATFSSMFPNLFAFFTCSLLISLRSSGVERVLQPVM